VLLGQILWLISIALPINWQGSMSTLFASVDHLFVSLLCNVVYLCCDRVVIDQEFLK
jgi:hypothetical protein